MFCERVVDVDVEFYEIDSREEGAVVGVRFGLVCLWVVGVGGYGKVDVEAQGRKRGGGL